jgi:hypothetical protein
MAFDTRVKDIVVLVVDREHTRHGQIGAMLYHDWREYGEIGVKFPDGNTEEFYDGIMKGDDPSKIQRFYRLTDDRGRKFDSEGCGPVSFQRQYLEHGGDLEQLAKQYRALFEEDLPRMPINSK